METEVRCNNVVAEPLIPRKKMIYLYLFTSSLTNFTYLCRHWTLPFQGERYSLVWFTPKGCEGIRGIDLKL